MKTDPKPSDYAGRPIGAAEIDKLQAAGWRVANFPVETGNCWVAIMERGGKHQTVYLSKDMSRWPDAPKDDKQMELLSV